MWARWAAVIQRRPRRAAIGGFALLALLALPTVGLRLGVADASTDPAGTTTKVAYDRLAQGFGPGFNGPFVVAADLAAAPGDTAALDGLSTRLAADSGVAFVGPARMDPSGSAALLTVVPTTSPQDPATVDLLEHLRADVIPASGVTAHVGGATPSNVDFADVMARRLPTFVGAVLVASFGLLLITFRSVLVPLKAVVMNLLSIGAAYGVIVAIFQWGWLGDLLGTGAGAPIEPWAPMMLFAIVFGLSMDYEVFLLSSIREHYNLTGDNSRAVAAGLTGTARVISAAAAIMVFVFGCFVFGDLRAIKLMGLGLATAVFIDATVVRLVLVPATMELLGKANWWLPRRLDRILPRFDVDGHAPTELPHKPTPARAA